MSGVFIWLLDESGATMLHAAEPPASLALCRRRRNCKRGAIPVSSAGRGLDYLPDGVCFS
jgi:hypothetical protein